jgi:hypothetical protein
MKMTPNKARKLLETAPECTTTYSNVVHNYTQAEFKAVAAAQVEAHAKRVGKTKPLSAPVVKKVYQAVKNMPHPRYDKS